MIQTAKADTASPETTQTGTTHPDTAIAPDLRRQLFAAQAWYADLVANIPDGQRTSATPCPDFDVRALLTHMATVNAKITGFATEHRDVLAQHELPGEERAALAEDWAREHVDGHSAAALANAARAESAAAQRAWTDETLDTPIQLGWGPIVPGRIVTAIYLMEVLAHAWDLATATGQPSEVPDDLGRAGLAAAMASLPDDMPRGMAFGVPFDPKVTPARDAGLTEQLVNWTGRISR